VVVSAPADSVPALLTLARETGVPLYRAGTVADAEDTLELKLGAEVFRWSIGALRRTYFMAIPRRMRHPDVDRSAGE
jgi:hypothetical protein